MPNSKRSELIDALGSVGTLGTHLVACTVVGGVLGYFLDDWLGTDPWLLLFMTLMGIVAGFRGVLQTVKKLERQEKEKRR